METTRGGRAAKSVLRCRQRRQLLHCAQSTAATYDVAAHSITNGGGRRSMTKPIRKLLPVLCAVALLLSGLPRPDLAHAISFTVETQTDAPHTQPIDGNCTSTLNERPVRC